METSEGSESLITETLPPIRLAEVLQTKELRTAVVPSDIQTAQAAVPALSWQLELDGY